MSFTRTCRRTLLVVDAGHERGHLVGDEMVHLHRDPTAAGLVDESRRLLDRLRPIHLGRFGPGGSPGDVDRRPGCAQLDSDPSSRPAGRTGNEGDLPTE